MITAHYFPPLVSGKFQRLAGSTWAEARSRIGAFRDIARDTRIALIFAEVRYTGSLSTLEDWHDDAYRRAKDFFQSLEPGQVPWIVLFGHNSCLFSGEYAAKQFARLGEEVVGAAYFYEGGGGLMCRDGTMLDAVDWEAINAYVANLLKERGLMRE